MVGVVKRLKLKAVEYDSLSVGSKSDCLLSSVQTNFRAKPISSSVHTGCNLRGNATGA